MENGRVDYRIIAAEEFTVGIHVDFRQQTFDVGRGKDDTISYHTTLWFGVADGGCGPAVTVAVPTGDSARQQGFPQAGEQNGPFRIEHTSVASHITPFPFAGQGPAAVEGQIILAQCRNRPTAAIRVVMTAVRNAKIGYRAGLGKQIGPRFQLGFPPQAEYFFLVVQFLSEAPWGAAYLHQCRCHHHPSH
ncbi:MAG: hypothetical protein KatS3mg110_1488 [Pirellulaceae bacterium]|nr:MAG: hypothetical protein KatS3mg110_1488 [Pirellulaceae bacterium]